MALESIKNKAIAIIFAIFLSTISILSSFNLMNYYVNDVTGYNEWNASTNSKFETDYISNFWLKYQYVNFNGAMRNLTGQHDMNGVIKLNNGYLNSSNPLSEDLFIDNSACKTAMFETELNKRGIEYVWFTLPYTVDKYNPQTPLGCEEDFGNNNLDRLTNAFIYHGVTTVDLRDNLHKQQMETYDIFYKTDHHWTTEGGFWAYNQVMDYVEELYGIEADKQVRDINNYSIEKYEGWHLGSQGQRTGKYFAGLDDFDLILPKFDTYIEAYDDSNYGGTFQEMMINTDALQKSDYMSRYTYDSVLGASCGKWHNPNAAIDKTVVIISDSMSKAVLPYMALSFTNVIYYLDYDVNEINENYINQYNPDLIISMNYITNTVSDASFDWGLLKTQEY